ncbi:TolC family protein [Horticoccus sp. 23ND18S-11]|uniref:TolC family protein n=1 Tax=Horticoccus sp. 23ND18S-11 TaxID=3391832 RepID=UPI0039C9B44C
MSLILPAAGPGQTTAPSPELSALLRVVTEAPALTAASRRALAARERVDASGRLANPEVEGMTSRMNGPMGTRSTMYELNVRQPLPKRGERAADRDRARAGVAMADADYALMAGEMAADTAMALAEAWSAEARVRLLQIQLGRMDSVLRSVEVRLAAGATGKIADRLTVQTRVASMQLMIEQERKMAADALSDARGRLGLTPESPLPEFAAPVAADVDVTDAAVLRLAAAKGVEADAMVKMARASANPMTSVGLRLERERTGMGDEDTIGVAFMSEIPFRSRRYARSDIRAAEAERIAAQSEATAARHRITAAVTRVERAERLAATSRRLSAETLGRLNAEYDAMIRSAGVASAGESTVLQTVELLEKATETEFQIIQADLAVRTARAELWRYLPAERFLNSNR